MAPRNRLVLIVLAAVALASAASHVVIRWVGIETTPIRQWSVGASNSAPPVVAMGSSLTFFGFAFDQISDALGATVICRSAASASPCELEQLIPQDVQPRVTVIGVSIFDLNEHYLSDFRADLVPASRSASDLWQSGSSWPFVKKIMGQYPLHYARWLFPTAGRSTAVMAGLRDRVSRPKQVLIADPHYRSKRDGSLDDWDSARLVSNIAALKVAAQNQPHGFNGPKRLALQRLLAAIRGPVLVAVLPVSPPYQREFVDEARAAQFEQELEEARRSAPDARWLRLDRLPELNSTKVFWDLGHMNDEGQRLATLALLAELRKPK